MALHEAFLIISADPGGRRLWFMSIGWGEVMAGSMFSRQEGPHVSKERGQKAEERNRRQEVGRASP